jgi:putative endonuclease
LLAERSRGKPEGEYMPYMYILECSDGTFYTGSTWNLNKRLNEHNEGLGANYTSKRLPVKLVFFEFFERISNAFQREKQVQNWSHGKKKALIDENWERLRELAECMNETHCRNVPLDFARGTNCSN